MHRPFPGGPVTARLVAGRMLAGTVVGGVGTLAIAALAITWALAVKRRTPFLKTVVAIPAAAPPTAPTLAASVLVAAAHALAAPFVIERWAPILQTVVAIAATFSLFAVAGERRQRRLA